jgi:hypothetical protein
MPGSRPAQVRSGRGGDSHEGMFGADHACRTEPFQPAHWPQPGLQAPMISFNGIMNRPLLRVRLRRRAAVASQRPPRRSSYRRHARVAPRRATRGHHRRVSHSTHPSQNRSNVGTTKISSRSCRSRRPATHPATGVSRGCAGTDSETILFVDACGCRTGHPRR